MVVKHTAIFFGCKAQAALEYFILLLMFALITIIGVSAFFAGVEDIGDYLFNEAVIRIVQ